LTHSGHFTHKLADTLPTNWSHVIDRSGKVRQSKTDILSTEPRHKVQRDTSGLCSKMAISPDSFNAHNLEPEVDRVHAGGLPLEHVHTTTAHVWLSQHSHNHSLCFVYKKHSKYRDRKADKQNATKVTKTHNGKTNSPISKLL